MATERKNLKNLLVTNWKPRSLDIYVSPPTLVGREIYCFRALRLSGWMSGWMDGCHKVCLRFFSLTIRSISMKLHMHSWYQV